MLPGRGGNGKEVRTDPPLADLPIIILSVKRPEDEQADGAPVDQVQAFMTKPFSVIELGNKIKKYLPAHTIVRSPIKRHSPFTSLFVVFNYSWWRRLLVIFPVLVVIGLVALTMWPNIGAIGAAWLWPLIGNQGVAALETAFFTVQDTVRQWQYRLGLAQPTTPWAIPSPQTPPPVLSIATITPTAPGIVPLPTIPPPIPLQTSATPAPTTTIAPTLTPTPAGWQLMPVPALGSLTGEGQWVAYLYSPAGKVVAYRTFLQPDPERPFALAAVVAFDLAQTHLHFVLGKRSQVYLMGHEVMVAFLKVTGKRISFWQPLMAGFRPHMAILARWPMVSWPCQHVMVLAR